MTEQEWLTGVHPGPLLAHLLQGSLSERKSRLFRVACCRRIWSLFADERSRQAVEAAEAFADGEISGATLQEAHGAALQAPSYGSFYNASTAAVSAVNPIPGASVWSVGMICAWTARASARAQAIPESPSRNLIRKEYAVHCHLLRDLFSNPFRTVSIDPTWLDWNDALVTRIAEKCYQERAFDRLPILADALEEAGCDHVDLLNHCRQPGEHVRGCWVVDLLLGKE